jgi:hypothetical protein
VRIRIQTHSKHQVGLRIKYQSDLFCSGDKIWYHWWKLTTRDVEINAFQIFHLRAQHYVNAPVTNRCFSLSSKRSGLAEVPNVTGVKVVSKLNPELSEMAHNATEPHFNEPSERESFRWERSFVCHDHQKGPVIGFKFRHSTKLVVVNPRQTADGVWSNQPQTPSPRIDHSYRLVSH